jgi:hypothetical protein
VNFKPPEEPQGAKPPDTGIAPPLPDSAIQAKASDALKIIAQQEARVPLWKDFCFFLLYNKKWWLLPILVILLLLSLLMLLSTSAVAPFIYTIF